MSFVSEFKKNKMLQTGEEDDYTRLKKRIKENGVKITGVKDEEAEQWLRKATSTADERTKYSKNTSYKDWKTKNKYMYKESSDLYKRGKEIQAYLNAKARDDESYAGYRDSANELLKELSRSTNSMIASDQKYGRFGSESEYNDYINEQEKIKRVRDATRRSKIKSKSQQMNEGLRKNMGLENTTLGSEQLENAVALDRLKKRIAEKDALEKDTQYYKRLLTDDSQMDANTRRQALEKLKRTIMTEQIAGDSKTLSDLSKSFSNATGKKVSQTDAYQMLENAQGQIDRDKYDQKMGEKRKELEKVLDEKGFETAAKKGSQIAQKKTVYNADMLAGYQNEDKSYPDIFKSQTEYEQYQDMTDTEKDVFNYYLATEGVQKAKEYLNAAKRDITKRQNEAYTEKMKQYATEHPALSSESSVAAGFATGLGALETMRQNAENVLTGNNAPVDINSKPFRPANAQNTIRNTVMENFQGSEDVKALKRFLYQTGMSMADFGTQAAAGALVGGFAGEAASLAGASAERAAQITATIANNASLPIMGAGAMSQTVKEVIENGGTNDQAMQLGLIAGAAEMVTERLGIDNLSKLSSQGVNSVKRAVHKIIAEGAIPEGLEEVVSDIVNNVANDAIMQENSDFNQAVERYMTPNAMTGEHISRRQAEDLAMKDRIKDMALSFAGGALSGGIMAAGAYGSGYIEGGYLGRELNSYEDFSDAQLIRDGKAMTGTNSADLAEYYEGKGKLSDRQRAELFNQILQDSDGKYTPSPEITLDETENAQAEAENAQAGGENAPVELTAEDLHEPQIDAQAKEKKTVQENVRQREKEPETGTQRSVEGVNYKGLQGDITGIDRVENGKIYARVNTGDATIVQPVSNLNFDNAVTQALYQTAEGYDDAGARSFVKDYEGENLITYKRGFDAYYNAARAGMNWKTAKNTNNIYGDIISDHQKIAAFNAGIADAENSFEKRFKKLKEDRSLKTRGSQIIENEAFRGLSKEAQDMFKSYAKISGANIVVDESIHAGNGRYANGYYDNNGTLHIAADSTNPFSVVSNHELTHYLKQYTPIYDEYKNYVMEYLMKKDSVSTGELIEKHISEYENAGRQISREEAMDEIVANASELFLTDESAVQQLVKENKSIGEKILDFFKEFISSLKEMLTGYEPKSKEAQMLNEDLEAAQKAEKIWLEAMQSAKEAGKKAQENTITGGEIKKSFSPKEDMNFSIREEEGERYVNVDTDQELFEGMDDAEAAKMAKTIIKDRFQGKKLEKNALVSSKTAGEYTHPAKRMKKDAYRAKMQASTELDNLVKVSEFIGHKNDENGRHGKMAANGWDYYKTIFRLGDRYFEGKVNIAKGTDVDVLYDITDIKEREIAKSPSGQSKENPISISNLSENNITNAEGKVNEKDIRYQMEDTSEVDYDTLKAENKELRSINKNLQDMIALEYGAEPQQDAIRKVSKHILKEYESEYDTKTLEKNLTAIWKYLANNQNPNGEELAAATSRVAKGILEKSKHLDTEMRDQYKDMLKGIRNTKMKLDEQYRGDLDQVGGYSDFRKKNFGKIRLSNEGIEVDSYYQELASQHPELFDAEKYTTPADQLMNIADVVQMLQPTYINPYGMNMDQAAADLAYKIYDSYYNIAKKGNALETKKIAELNRARSQFKERQGKIREEMQQRYEERLKALKAENETLKRGESEKLLEQKAKYDSMIRRRAQLREESGERTQLLKALNRINRMRSTPENMKKAQELIGNIDLVAKSMTAQGQYNLELLRDRYNQELKNNPDFTESKSIEDRIKRLDKEKISEMGIGGVRDLLEAVLEFEHKVRTDSKQIDSEWKKTNYDLARKIEDEVKASKGYNPNNPASNFTNMYNTSILSAEREFRKIAGYAKNSQMEQQAKELNKGQLKKTKFQQDAAEYFRPFIEKEGKWIDTVTGEKAKLVKIGEKNGKDIMVTPAMRMSLYLHAKAEANLRHIIGGTNIVKGQLNQYQGGGITVPDMTLYQKGKISDAYARGETIKLTKTGLQKILAEMTPKEKRFAEMVSEFFNGQMKEAINDTSLKLDGFEKGRVTNYFPIRTDKNFTNTDFDTLIKDATIEGMGILKQRSGGTNPVMLEDIFNVLNRQIDSVSSYYGLAIPIRNFNKIYNSTASGYESSVKSAIAEKWGTRGQKYIENLLSDLQGGRKSEMNWLDRLRGRYAQAVLTLNPSVTMKQAASYPTAAATLGWGPITKALVNQTVRTDRALIDKYSPLLWYRNQGNVTNDIADINQAKTWATRAPKPIQKYLLNWIQNTDTLTVQRLWLASEYYVQDEMKVKKGTEGYYEKVAEVYNRVIEDTQPNYTVMQRPDILRSTNQMTKALTMFSTQRLQNYGIVYDAIGEYRARLADMKKGTGTKEDVRAAGKNLARAFSSQIVAAAVLAGMTFIAGAALHREKNWEDEAGNITTESFMKQFGKDFGATIAGSSIGGSELYEFLTAMTGQEKWWGFETSSVATINDFGEDVKTTYDALKNLLTGDGSYQAVTDAIKAMGVDASKFFGVPVENTKKIIDGAILWKADAKAGTFLKASDQHYPEYKKLWEYEKAGKTKEYTALLKELQDELGETAVKKGLQQQQISELGYREEMKEIIDAREKNDLKSYKESMEKLEDAGYTKETIMKFLNSKQKVKDITYDELWDVWQNGTKEQYEDMKKKMMMQGKTEDSIKTQMKSRQTANLKAIDPDFQKAADAADAGNKALYESIRDSLATKYASQGYTKTRIASAIKSLRKTTDTEEDTKKDDEVDVF